MIERGGRRGLVPFVFCTDGFHHSRALGHVNFLCDDEYGLGIPLLDTYSGSNEATAETKDWDKAYGIIESMLVHRQKRQEAGSVQPHEKTEKEIQDIIERHSRLLISRIHEDGSGAMLLAHPRLYNSIQRDAQGNYTRLELRRDLL
jgi:hypothetical protein